MDERVDAVTSSTAAGAAHQARTAQDIELDVDRTSPLSFEAFYRANRDPLARAVALAVGDVDLAAESIDEAMIRAYQRWSRVATYDRPTGWVFRVAINHSRSRLRRVARKSRFASVFDVDRHEDTPFEHGIADSALAKALATLDADQRAVVVLRVLLEFSELECATALDIRPGTAKSRLHRGLAQLRRAVPHLAPQIDAVAAATPTRKQST